MSKIPSNVIPIRFDEIPDRWIVVKIVQSGETLHKVLCGWIGGYLEADRWKINSGIEKVTQDDDYFYFHGYSGSVYKCNKKNYGLTNASAPIFEAMQKHHMVVTEQLPSDYDFMSLNK